MILKYINNKSIQIGAFLTSLAMSGQASATMSLPTPVTTVSDGNYITMLQSGFASLAVLLSGVFGILSLIIMAGLFAWEFVQVNQGKKTWGNLAITMAVGGLTLVIIYILLNQAKDGAGSGF